MKGPLLQVTERNNWGCASCGHRCKSMFSNLSHEDLNTLNAKRKEILYKKGKTLFSEGEHPKGIFCLKSGYVKLSKMGIEGIEQITGLKKPVDFLGYHAVLAQKDHAHTATALVDCKCCIIDKKDFLKVVQKKNDLALRLLNAFANETIETEERMMNLTQKHMRGRLAEALLMLAEIYGFQKDGRTLKVELKRSELAALSNMTTANAIRMLSAFSKESLINLNKRKIEINDFQTLKTIGELNQ